MKGNYNSRNTGSAMQRQDRLLSKAIRKAAAKLKPTQARRTEAGEAMWKEWK